MAASDSFWELGNYKRTTKRIEDGYKLCSDLIALIQERAEIENHYAKSLKTWSSKWTDAIEKGPEYGTTEAAWKGVMIEADRLGDLHMRVKEDLLNNVVRTLKMFQKSTYHKSILHIKERRELEESFKIAQQPWAKLLAKVKKTKSDYYSTCRAEKTASIQERNATDESSLSMDHLRKIQNNAAKSKANAQSCKDKYVVALLELNSYNPKYIEDMTVIFEKCQTLESQRLQFLKHTLLSLHKVLNITQDPLLLQIYAQFHDTINNAEYKKDLKWWSDNHGVNMAMQWPQFEEYTEEFKVIVKTQSRGTDGITLINERHFGEDLCEYQPTNSNMNKQKETDNSGATHSCAIASTEPVKVMDGKNSRNTGSQNNLIEGGDNPFEEVNLEALPDDGEPGIAVRAFYEETVSEELCKLVEEKKI